MSASKHSLSFNSSQIEATAKAWMEWQFPGRCWDDAVPEMKSKFIDGAIVALTAFINFKEEKENEN